MITMPGYRITEQLHEGARTLIYRGLEQPTQRPVIIKIFGVEYPPLPDIARLKREYEIAGSLALDGVVRPYGLEPYKNGLALILEDCGGEPLQHSIREGGMPLAAFFPVAIQLTEILGQIHGQKIVHKDIKPRNIIYNASTGRVQLTDFGIASRLASENAISQNPRLLQGTLGYMSPEQTGRMNQPIDYRSDFYSLGATFYEMLTGRMPFNADDPMELVHCHLARIPTAPHVLNPAVPPALAAVVLKLLAKTPRERYQSAHGLRADLRECARQWEAKGDIESFPLGHEDLAGQFQIPQQLYGREAEVAALLEAFNRVSQGAREMLMVAGYSGIGKSSLVHEVHKPIVRQRGYFVSGKFDQFNRNIPYASLIQAFQELMRQILTETEAQVAGWRERLLDALGGNGQVLIDVIPEVELIIGPQPAVPELRPREAQGRLNLVLQRFMGVFARAEHPLVLFLDDLQWADAASLTLLEWLMTDAERRYLFLIGAYRDNEVNSGHPLMLTLGAIEQTGTGINQIQLGPLGLDHVNRLLSDTLHCAAELARPLADLLFYKTGGNPFFLNQLLKSLYQDRLLEFEAAALRWHWDLSRIQRMGIPDNVVDFMGGKIQKLPPATQQVLQLAACVGNTFDSATLAVVYEKPQRATAADLWAALQEGLVLPLDDSYKLLQPEESTGNGGETLARPAPAELESLAVPYKFAHDRVQQAAYALIGVERRQELHLTIGRLLLQNTPDAKMDDAVFDIVNHLNAGQALISDAVEHNRLRQLNIVAGRKAKASTAYAAALKHFTTAMELAPEQLWASDYDLAFELYKERAECEYLTSHFEAAERFFDESISHARTNLEKVAIWNTRILFYTNVDKTVEAVQGGIEALKMLGIDLPMTPGKMAVGAELVKSKLKLRGKRVAELVNLPDITDPEKSAALSILMNMGPAAYFVTPDLYALVVLKMVNISLQYGNADVSAFAYCSYGMIIGSGFGDYKNGYEFGKMGLEVSHKFNNTYLIGRNYFVFGAFIQHWTEPAHKDLDYFWRAHRLCLECGDLVFSTYPIGNLAMHHAILGTNLNEFGAVANTYYDAIAPLKDNTVYDIVLAQRWILALQGLTEAPYSFSDAEFDETSLRQTCEQCRQKVIINFYYLTKMSLLFLFDRQEEALAMARLADPTVDSSFALLMVAEHCFYDALIRAAAYPVAAPDDQAQHWKRLRHNRRKLQRWAAHGPANFEHKYLLVAAELARISGKHSDAADLYDRAIRAAQDSEYIQNGAIANELAAKFHLGRDNSKLARAYMTDAHYGYTRWGATAKVHDLERKYGDLLQAPVAGPSPVIGPSALDLKTTTDPLNDSKSSALDLGTVIKASQALSGEIDLGRLLRQLMRFAIENAGAQKGFLILEKAGQLVIEAEGAVEETDVVLLQSLPVEQSQDIPATIIHYVARTRENLVLQDATHEGSFTADPYVLEARPRSILCAPIVHQAKLIGILYLENRLTVGAFTPDRLEVLKIISSQAAISLQNAMLYSDLRQATDDLRVSNDKLEDYSKTLEHRVEERTAELQTKNGELEQALRQLQEMQQKVILQEKMASLGALTAGVAHEIKNPLNFVNNFALLSADLVRELLDELSRHEEKFAPETRAYLEEILHDLEQNSQKINEHGKRADSIVRSMLLHSRGQAGRPELTDINALVDESINLCYHGQRASNPTFNITLEKDYDATVGSVEVAAQEISRVILNIANNACYAVNQKQQTAGPGYVPTLAVRTKNVGEAIEIRIRDNGNGIPPATAQQIFNPFFTTKPAGAGTGLGLSMSYDIIVQQHRGDVQVESVEGEYAEFSITLPRGGSGAR